MKELRRALIQPIKKRYLCTNSKCEWIFETLQMTLKAELEQV